MKEVATEVVSAKRSLVMQIIAQQITFEVGIKNASGLVRGNTNSLTQLTFGYLARNLNRPIWIISFHIVNIF